MRRRWSLTVLLLIALFTLAGCTRPGPADPGPGFDLGADPEVGGGVGEDSGPQTPIPTATATNEASPRLDPTAAALATFPPASPALQPTAAPPTATSPAEPTMTDSSTAGSATAEPTATAEPAATAEATAAATPAETGEIIHVVQAGETLYRIGLQYGLSWVVIAEYNGITNPDAINAGQELRIPPAAPETTPTAESVLPTAEEVAAAPSPPASAEQIAAVERSAAVEDTYTVSAGDTLYDIARQYGVSWEQLAEANGLTSLNQIYSGQLLKIPADVPGPAHDFAHRTRSGETLSAIARQYGLEPAELAAANGLTEPYIIYPGQEILIPGE